MKVHIQPSWRYDYISCIHDKEQMVEVFPGCIFVPERSWCRKHWCISDIYHNLRLIFMHANHIHLIKIREKKISHGCDFYFALNSTADCQDLSLSICLSFPWWCVQGALYEFHFMSISCHFLSEISQMSEALTPHCLVYFRCPSSPHFYRRWLCRRPDLNYKTETHEISLL